MVKGGVCGEWGACVVKGGVHSKGRVCMVKGGMHGKGEACMTKPCMVKGGGMHGEGGACVAKGGHAWQGGHAWYAHPPSMRYGRSMRGRYASYWNAFLLRVVACII